MKSDPSKIQWLFSQLRNNHSRLSAGFKKAHQLEHTYVKDSASKNNLLLGGYWLTHPCLRGIVVEGPTLIGPARDMECTLIGLPQHQSQSSHDVFHP